MRDSAGSCVSIRARRCPSLRESDSRPMACKRRLTVGTEHHRATFSASRHPAQPVDRHDEFACPTPSAVRSEMKSFAPISRLVRPSATRRATSRSRRDNFGGAMFTAAIFCPQISHLSPERIARPDRTRGWAENIRPLSVAGWRVRADGYVASAAAGPGPLEARHRGTLLGLKQLHGSLRN